MLNAVLWIDSIISGTRSIPKPYANQLRERDIAPLEAGASRPEPVEDVQLTDNSVVQH
jgi:hypothetical protein